MDRRRLWLCSGQRVGDGSEQEFMRNFQDTDRLKILLSHIPEGLLLWESMDYWDVDLVFSGHVHGGQARLPFIGGLGAQKDFLGSITCPIWLCVRWINTKHSGEIKSGGDYSENIL